MGYIFLLLRTLSFFIVINRISQASPKGLKQLIEGSYEQSSTPPSNDWHYVNIRCQNGSENIFTWKNKAGVEWDLIFVEKENSGVFKFQVGEDCPYNNEQDGYTEGRLFTNNAVEIEGPSGIYTKQTSACASGCSLMTHWGDTNSLDHVTRDIFVVWWEKQYDHEEDARGLLATLSQCREDCLSNLSMADPPNPGRGFFYNVYIHHNQGEVFPTDWALGQGTDQSGNPFLTVPFQSLGGSSIWHEGFHVFQYSATSTGFAYAGDSQWYIESSAQWYMAQWMPYDDPNMYAQAGTILGNPQLALWHSYNNEAPGDFGYEANDVGPGWMYGVRQYGMHTLLNYLTEVVGIDRDIVTAGFYANTELSPQEYFVSRVGSELFRSQFADWAGHNCANLDYITREQYKRALESVTRSGDWSVYRPSVWQAVDQGTNGWISAPADLSVRGWAYNVWNITNSEAAVYTFQLDGDKEGSQGGEAWFEGRVVILQEDGGSRHQSMMMDSNTTGKVQVSVRASDSQVMLAVVSVPENYGSYQTYGYRAQITRELV